MKNLVSGGTGLVGSHLIRALLARGESVRALKRGSSSIDLTADVNDQVEWIDCDILDVIGLEEAMQGIDRVYHSAALVSFEPNEFPLMMQINVEGTANMVNAAKDAGVQKFLHVSSVAAIGRQEGDRVISEKDSFTNSKFDTQYGYSKFNAEREVWRAQEEGLDTVIVNPAVIIGEGRWDISSGLIFYNVWNGLKFYTDGSNGFVDVKDVVGISIGLMDSDITGQRFIASAENQQWEDAFGMIADAFGKKRPTIRLSKFIQEIAWRIEWVKAKVAGMRPLVTRESLKSATMKVSYDNSKVREALNYQFIPLEDSIKRTCAAFLSQQNQ